MRYIVKNITRRPVSILCNSGRSYHLPPKYEHELAGIEIDNNAFIRKLYDRKILDVIPLREKKTATGDVENASDRKKQPDEKKKSDAKTANTKKE